MPESASDSVSPYGSTKPPGYEQYFDYPSSVFDLSRVASDGLIPLGVIASISFAATLLSAIWIGWRLVQSARNPRAPALYQNQLLLLILNLLIADTFQAMSFIFSFHWKALGMILAPTSSCWAQAWFLHLGDVSSGSFVMAIAVHTWYKITRLGRHIPHWVFVSGICSLWAFSLLVASLGPLIRGGDDFVRAGLWCWINVKYEDDRLSLHYIWIFIYECGTIALYAFIWWKLYQHARECRAINMHVAVRSKIERSQKLMAVYPIIYVVFTLPLAFGRMWSMAHHGAALPDAYMVVAGCLIASCGWMDALMYTLTRGVFNKGSGNQNNGSNSHSRGDTERKYGNGHGNGNAMGINARDRIHGFDDMTALRTLHGDGDVTPPEPVTTVIVGGKEEQAHGYGGPPKTHRILGINRKTSLSKPHLGRVEELVDDEKDLIDVPRPRAGANSNRISPILLRMDWAGDHYPRSQSRSHSPSGSDETRVPSNGSDNNVPPTEPASLPFGVIKKETSVRTTRSPA